MQIDWKRDKMWLIYYSLLLLVITTVPYLIAYSQNSSMVYTGFVFGVQDGNSYIAKMLSGANGDWLFRSPYSAAEQDGFLAFLPYMLLGKLSAPPAQHEQLVFLFHVFRWAASIFMIFVTYRFTSLFIHSRGIRKVVTVMATAGGGLGWLTIFGLNKLFNVDLPLEFYSPETFGFLSILGLPHLAAARGLLLLGLIGYMKETQSIQNRLLASLSWLMLGFFQPLTIVTGWALLAAHLLLISLLHIIRQRNLHELIPQKWKENVRTAIFMAVVSSPWVIYNLVSFRMNRYLSGWESQNIIQSPPPVDYLFSFSLILPFSIAAIVKILSKSRKPVSLLPVTFVFLFPLLAYAPFNLQRRLPESIWVFLTVLGFMTIEKFRRRPARLTVAFVLGASLLTPLIILGGSIQAVRSPALPLFRSAEEVAAFKFIRSETPARSVVAASYLTSNAMPAWAPVFVLTGHGPESTNLEEMEANLTQLYGGEFSKDEVPAFLENFSVDYIFYGPVERAIGEWNPEETTYLELVYNHPPYQIFRMIQMEQQQAIP